MAKSGFHRSINPQPLWCMRLVHTLYGSKVRLTTELAHLYRNKAVSLNISNFIYLIRATKSETA
ncbi:unnamed protein product [Brassica oleracea]